MQIQFRLLTFRPLVLKQLNSLTTIDTFSILGGQGVMHPTGALEVPGSIPGSGNDLTVWFVVVVDLLFCPKHILILQFLLPRLIHYTSEATFGRFMLWHMSSVCPSVCQSVRKLAKSCPLINFKLILPCKPFFVSWPWPIDDPYWFWGQ